MNAETFELIIKVLGAPAIIFVFLGHLQRIKNGSKGKTRFEKMYIEEKQNSIFEQIIYVVLIIWVNYTFIYDYDFDLFKKTEFNLFYFLSTFYYIYVYIYFSNFLFKVNGWYYRIVNYKKQYYISINPLIKVVYLSKEKTVNQDRIITDTVDKDTEYIKHFENDKTTHNFRNLIDTEIDWRLSYIINGLILILTSLFCILISVLFFKESQFRSLSLLLISIIILIIGVIVIFYTSKKIYKRRKQNKAPAQKSE
ncbi:hypothetical protein [Macrococcoides caseolyticum]|uniref:hypothetical protein n=1 Tax=Macrococcoides caseolyticum TaxID=69966 RepID=UPI001F2D8CFA|nr:hypothetical protein [Macrococcus caseolyticus]MCE4957243.1 hypothetical protein [Macrococcus caseolyticus]